MLRLAFYALLTAALTYGGVWLANHQGSVVIEWQGYEITMQLGILVGMSLCVSVILITIILLLRALLLTPKHLREAQRKRHHEKAISALNHTMTALALGDHREAQRQLNKSRYYLKGDPPVTRLLGVQLAHATGKDASARDALDTMLEDTSTRAVALRGKIRELMREGQWVHARDFAEEAFDDRPNDHWIAMVLLDIVMRENDWAAAARVIDTASRKKSLTSSQTQHYRATLLLARAHEAIEQKQFAMAQQHGEMAVKYQPSMLAAHLVVLQALGQQGNAERILAWIEKSWAHAAHPTLSELFLQHGIDAANPARSLKRLTRMIGRQPDQLEALLLKAQAHLKLAAYDEAREALMQAQGITESPRIYQLFAELESAQHADDKLAAQWLSQALSAPRDESWVCSHCHTEHSSWHMHCQHCGQFDALAWTRPSTPATAESLSLAADAATTVQS